MFFNNSNNAKEQKVAFGNYDNLKMVLLGISFFFIICSYSILRPLKSSIFIGLVGKEYIPIAKIFSIFNLFPCILLYAKLVDKMKKQQVVYIFLTLYSLVCFIFAFYAMHPTIGINNSQTSPYRIMGWLFYFLLDLYSPLVVSTFWAYTNSICTPEYANKNYAYIVTFSRIGGILTASLGWILMEQSSISTTTTTTGLIFLSGLFIILAAFCIFLLIKKVPEHFLHGYQAAYKIEKDNKEKIGLWEGLKLMLIQPYVLGIFILVYGYEVISVIIDYQMQVLMAIEKNNSIGGMSSFMFMYTAAFQALGLIFAIFGTSKILRYIKLEKSILIMPIATLLLMGYLIINPSLATIFVLMVILRALHYSFDAPLKEILYIPTNKNIKFKSKAWIESFGKSISKSSGSAFNIIAKTKDSLAFIRTDSIFAILISIVWLAASYFVGRKYKDTILNNQVIGEDLP